MYYPKHTCVYISKATTKVMTTNGDPCPEIQVRLKKKVST